MPFEGLLASNRLTSKATADESKNLIIWKNAFSITLTILTTA